MSEQHPAPQKQERARPPAPGNEQDIQDADCETAALPSSPLSTGAPPNRPVNEASGSEDDLAVLRRLLFQPEMAELKRLRQRLDDPATHAHDVADILAEALLIRSRKDGKLATVLEPMMESILGSALRKRPREFVSVLFPVMGPAIRRSIVENFRSMLESLNKSLEMSFSWKGLRWRIEALRTGKPFAEVVLLNTLLYRVEQIFFIHKETGLVLAHEVNSDVEAQDPDMISAMLTAIQDFTRDCFAGGREGHLDSLQFDDFTIFIEPSDYAYLACVIRGTPPANFREKLQDSFELMLIEYADALRTFKGDTGPFQTADKYLQNRLVSRSIEENHPLPLWFKALPVLALLGIVATAGMYWHTTRLDQKAALEHRAQLEQGVALLRKEPGIVVLYQQHTPSGLLEITCMRDEFARSYEEILREKKLDAAQYIIHSTPYISYDRAAVVKRVAARLDPPSSVSCTLMPDDTLRISGSAPIEWILRTRHDALSIPGVKKLDMRDLADPRMKILQSLIDEVESARIEFPIGKNVPTPETQGALSKAMDTLARLDAMAKDMRITVSLAVYGFADTRGTEKRNYILSQERAQTLVAMLYNRGSSIPVTVYGMGEKTSGANDSPASRRIDLRVRITPVTPAVIEAH